MNWISGAIGGFILFLYGIVPTLQPSYFHRIYAAYGGIFIVMALLWSSIFEGIAPDMFDVIGAAIACAGVAIIYYSLERRRKIMVESLASVVDINVIIVTLALFFVAALMEIGGGYLVWQWIREKKAILIGLTVV